MEWYRQWVTEYPLISAAIQFGILGTLGEIISLKMRRLSLKKLGMWWQAILRVIAWAILGIVIKYGFAGMKGFVDELMIREMLPFGKHGTFLWAVTVSVCTNVFFGPQMMFFHRLEENLIMMKWNTAGLKNAWLTLLWFWIPAHTVTFMLKAEYQIGLAALWSVVLGIILGLTSKK